MCNIQYKPINYLCIYCIGLERLNYTILAMVLAIKNIFLESQFSLQNCLIGVYNIICCDNIISCQLISDNKFPTEICFSQIRNGNINAIIIKP